MDDSINTSLLSFGSSISGLEKINPDSSFNIPLSPIKEDLRINDDEIMNDESINDESNVNEDHSNVIIDEEVKKTSNEFNKDDSNVKNIEEKGTSNIEQNYGIFNIKEDENDENDSNICNSLEKITDLLLESDSDMDSEGENEDLSPINEMKLEDESEEGKYFIKTVEEIPNKDGNGYFLSHGLTQKTFESSNEFKHVKEIKDYSNFLHVTENGVESFINLYVDYRMILFGTICLRKSNSVDSLPISEKFGLLKYENSNELLDIPSSCDPNCVVELIEYNGGKYVTLRVIRDIIYKGAPLYLDNGTIFCFDPHKNK